MKVNDLIDIIGDIDDSMIADAKSVGMSKKHSMWLKWGVAAFAVCAAAALAVIVIPRITANLNKTNKDKNDQVASDYKDETNDNEQIYSSNADMPALVVYNGNTYMVSSSSFWVDEEEFNTIVDEYLGTATGEINEWSAEDDYKNNLASTVPGEVYTVKGYDKNFRLCICGKIGEGSKKISIQYYECIKNESLKKGEDLFENMLHIKEMTKELRYQSDYAWSVGDTSSKELCIDEKIFEEFVKQIDEAEFFEKREYNLQEMIPTYDACLDKLSESSSSETINGNSTQAHLVLIMDDGSSVNLRLIEGGYVTYDSGLHNWQYVKIPGGVFDQVFSACMGVNG